MATNTGKETRKGQVKNRSQTYNDKTGQYVKRDKKTGRFISCKSTPYKGVKNENKSKEKSKTPKRK